MKAREYKVAEIVKPARFVIETGRFYIFALNTINLELHRMRK